MKTKRLFREICLADIPAIIGEIEHRACLGVAEKCAKLVRIVRPVSRFRRFASRPCEYMRFPYSPAPLIGKLFPECTGGFPRFGCVVHEKFV